MSCTGAQYQLGCSKVNWCISQMAKMIQNWCMLHMWNQNKTLHVNSCWWLMCWYAANYRHNWPKEDIQFSATFVQSHFVAKTRRKHLHTKNTQSRSILLTLTHNYLLINCYYHLMKENTVFFLFEWSIEFACKISHLIFSSFY